MAQRRRRCVPDCAHAAPQRHSVGGGQHHLGGDWAGGNSAAEAGGLKKVIGRNFSAFGFYTTERRVEIRYNGIEISELHFGDEDFSLYFFLINKVQANRTSPRISS